MIETLLRPPTSSLQLKISTPLQHQNKAEDLANSNVNPSSESRRSSSSSPSCFFRDSPHIRWYQSEIGAGSTPEHAPSTRTNLHQPAIIQAIRPSTDSRNLICTDGDQTFPAIQICSGPRLCFPQFQAQLRSAHSRAHSHPRLPSHTHSLQSTHDPPVGQLPTQYNCVLKTHGFAYHSRLAHDQYDHSQHSHIRRKIPVVYYLCINEYLEHLHFIEVPISSLDGLYLRDVICQFNVLRGKGMPTMYSWSCKRSQKIPSPPSPSSSPPTPPRRREDEQCPLAHQPGSPSNISTN
ncbi:hypothetical protein MA16_Dca025597 [Dendrobium catenatum]|uniref:SOSEKI DIX-like domain-containing protein n=1 Tax=Dendrobium catenatum TaxID=906689 RepID=A0A2I0VAK3_9ASPA|nr:hypothetical protein MA16_Dca025597 [Dendrobium catenatum]